MFIKLEPRAQPSLVMTYASPLVAVVLTLIAGLIVFALLGVNPATGFRVYFINPLSDGYGLAEWLMKATPLMLCAMGLAIGYRACVWNIGAEGQFIAGAAAASLVPLYMGNLAHAPALVAMFALGALGGMLWALIPAWLRTQFNANEILVSLMLVYVAQLAVSWLVFGPMRDPEGMNFPQTKMFGDSFLLPIIWEGTRLNVSFVVTLILLALGHVFIKHSYIGFKMRVAGEAQAAARYAGFSAKAMVWIGFIAGGVGAGIAGMSEVAGPMGQLTDKVSTGYGFAAIIVAFIGRLSPIGIVLGSLLMALLFIGGEQVQQYLNLPASIAKVFQGMLLFFLLAADVFINYRLRVNLRRQPRVASH